MRHYLWVLEKFSENTEEEVVTEREGCWWVEGIAERSIPCGPLKTARLQLMWFQREKLIFIMMDRQTRFFFSF